MTASRHTTMRERDQEIARRFAAGEGRKQIAYDYGLTPRRTFQIAEAHGARHTRDQIQQLHEDGKRRAGRPRLHIPEEHRAFYVKARRHYGAALARELIGLAA